MILTIPRDENYAYRPRREAPEEMAGSFFSGVYQTAETYIQDMLDQFDTAGGEAPAEYSNILAVTGGRGAGKTSVMLNISGLLESGRRLDGSGWERTAFLCLPMIDPSHLTREETVIDVVLARMYSRFETFCRDNPAVSRESRRETYQAFGEAYRAVRVMCQSRESRHSVPDALDGLQYAAAGNDLRGLMARLVRRLLEVMTAGGRKSGCLVLCVDDVDMNIRQGYEICEELRKYLSVPNLVILFSLYMDQMGDLVRQQYLEDFSTLLRHEEARSLAEAIPNMAEKYLQKLIPFGHRCALPGMELQNLNAVRVRYEAAPDPAAEPQPLVDEVLFLMYRKTGLLLVKDKNNAHAFLPATLRGVTHLLSMLRKMEPVPLVRAYPGEQKREGHVRYLNHALTGRERAALEANLDTMARYLMEYGAAGLPQGSAAILQTLVYEQRERLNQRAVRTMLHELEVSGVELTKAERRRLNGAASEKLPYESATVGDVLYVLRLYGKKVHYYDGRGERFSALFKLLYSIRILRCFFLDVGEGAALDDRKEALFELLGGLIYNPGGDDVVRGDDMYFRRSIAKLTAGAGQSGFPALVDALLMGTVHAGTVEPALNNSLWSSLRTGKPDAYYEDVSREGLTGIKGNTLKYFTYSYLGCILSPLRKGLDIQNPDYQKWRESYLSPLPVLSADCIDAYVSELRRETENLRKSSSNLSTAFDTGSRRLIGGLLQRSCVDADTTAYLQDALDQFPFLKEDLALDGFLRDEDEPGAKAGESGAGREEETPGADGADLAARDRSLALCLSKLERARDKFAALKDAGELMRVQGVSTNGAALQEREKNRIWDLNGRIKVEKYRLRGLSMPTDQDVQGTIQKICHLIGLEIEAVGLEQEALGRGAE